MTKAIGYAARHAVSDLRPMFIERKAPASNEVAIDILFCGICHSDVHQAKNEWKNTIYPCMPGHEIVGRVSAAGASVTKYKLGDLVAVGCMVDSCHECAACQKGLEQYCEKGFLATYNGNMRNPAPENQTYGGYSDSIVVREDFVLRVPKNLDPAAAAPIVCAGVTTYSALKNWKAGPGMTVGVVGYGGLGQMATRIAAAMGATVKVITSKPEKGPDAIRRGAKGVINSGDENDMKANQASVDLIVSLIPQPHDANLYMPLLKRDGTYVVVGCIAPLKKPLDISAMITDRKSLGSTLIGSIAETQEVLDFCAKHSIVSEIKVIPVDQINEAFASVDKGEVDFRYVIDMASIRGKTEDESLAAKVGL